MTNQATPKQSNDVARVQEIQTEIDMTAIDHELQFMGDQLRQLRVQSEVGGIVAIDELEHRFTRLTREVALYKLSGKFGDESLSLDQIRDDARATADQIDELAAQLLPSEGDESRTLPSADNQLSIREAKLPPMGKLVQTKTISDEFTETWHALKRDLSKAYERIQDLDNRPNR